MAKTVKMKIRAGRTFHATTGEGDTRETRTFKGGGR